jgi:DNA-binding PadR family transcriptional regulator
MLIVKRIKQRTFSLPAKELSFDQMQASHGKLAQLIIMELAKKPQYPMELAKLLKTNEQKIYYHIRKLEKSHIVERVKTETVMGATANYYGITESAFVVRCREFQETQKITELDERPKSFLEPFIEEGELKSIIIVGSPDPHGPEKSRSRDGYYGIDLALFLGTFLNYIPSLNVKLDTEVHQQDLDNNIILIGGPVVNMVTARINSKLPIYFDRENNWAVVSRLSGKTYHSDDMGIIVKLKNPFNEKKSVLVIAGKRSAGTRAVIIAFLRHFEDILKGNNHNPKFLAKVVEGVDLDSDGIVDDAELLE